MSCGHQVDAEVLRGGRVRISCALCERHARGLCLDCTRPVSGRAWRCPEHQRTAKRAHERLYRTRYPEKAREKQARRWRSLPPEQQERRRARRRELYAADRKRILARKAAWESRHRIGIAAYQRRYRRTHAEQRRAAARATYYRHHPTRPALECVVCSAPIAWNGCGRPHTLCPPHHEVVYGRHTSTV